MIKRLYVIAGDENPQVEDDFGRPQTMELATPKGFVSIPDTDDEVVVVCPYSNDIDRVVAGVIEAAKYGVLPGDRLIITDNATIKLQKTGQIDILSNNGIVNIKAGSGTINIEATNINLTGTAKLNGHNILTS